MSIQTSLIINTFCRPRLLYWGLWSLTKQRLPGGLEVIIINDGLLDETEEICKSFAHKLNIRYYFTGQRNLELEGRTRWRIPGFGINFGVKQAQGEIIILSCAEMFHISTDNIVFLVEGIRENSKLLGIPYLAKDDRDGRFLAQLEKHDGAYEQHHVLQCRDLNSELPFVLSLHKKEFMEIGGYDEDFWGIAFDDNDLMDRLRLNGCRFVRTGAQVIHLYHPRYYRESNPGWDYNRNLYISRWGTIVRNENKEWGKG